ncbi:MAG: LysM peptidoglycan-binding domain-containing protein, partial [Acidobacteriales bacterium]|nr:LysM peptidoglycan-binding domain-containing protein [Terriglobales bacterium]
VQRALIAIGTNPGLPNIVGVNCGPGVVHTVAAGENLFRIAQRYGTSMGTILNANGLSNPNVIFVGQQLAIPCGSQSLPPQQTQGNTTQPVGGVNCVPFLARSPLDGLPYGLTTFYWDLAPGASGFRVNIYNLDGGGNRLAASFETDGAATSLVAEITNETVGEGFSFAWEVQALGVNGEAACTSVRTTMLRAARPDPQQQVQSTSCPPVRPTCKINNICERCSLGESQALCGRLECPTPP